MAQEEKNNIINSSDERIRKAILEGLIDCRDAPDLGWSNFGGIEIDDCIEWLEKQGEQKKTQGKYDTGTERHFNQGPLRKVGYEFGLFYI